MGDAVLGPAGKDSLGMVKTVIDAQECLSVGVEARNGAVDRMEGIVVAALAVLSLVVDDPLLHLHLAG